MSVSQEESLLVCHGKIWRGQVYRSFSSCWKFLGGKFTHPPPNKFSYICGRGEKAEERAYIFEVLNAILMNNKNFIKDYLCIKRRPVNYQIVRLVDSLNGCSGAVFNMRKFCWRCSHFRERVLFFFGGMAIPRGVLYRGVGCSWNSTCRRGTNQPRQKKEAINQKDSYQRYFPSVIITEIPLQFVDFMA